VKFLIVDDSATMRRILVNSLRRIGQEDTVDVSNGVEAIVKIQDNSIEFVIVDCHMPGMDGIELTIKIRAMEGGENLPILMVTTRSASDEIIRAAQAGVNNYIVKPFTPHILQEKIEQTLDALRDKDD